jgi:hypothetical protein
MEVLTFAFQKLRTSGDTPLDTFLTFPICPGSGRSPVVVSDRNSSESKLQFKVHGYAVSLDPGVLRSSSLLSLS